VDLAGLSVVFDSPTWTDEGWSAAFVQGDSYSGDRAQTIRITGYVGPDLSQATEIVATSRKVVQGCWQDSPAVEWPMVVAADVADWVFTLELTSEQMSISAGQYTFEAQARWASGEVVTVVGPSASLVVVAGQSVE
jgi:hypothetical protein